MKAQVWRLSIVNSVFEASRGFSYPIIEIYVPELGMAINEQTCFKSSREARYEGHDPDIFGSDIPDPVLIETITLTNAAIDWIKDMKKGEEGHEKFFKQFIKPRLEKKSS